jgi:hypothetical protein
MGVEEHTAGSLRRIVAGLCEETAARDHLPAGLRRCSRAIGRELGNPLRVAIGGEVSAGKSTLVNALLGRRVAEVRPDETRRVTTSFRWAGDGDERACAIFADGSVRTVSLAAGDQLPQPQDLGDGTVKRWEVYLRSTALESFDIVDTPGLFSAEPGYSDAGRRSLLGAECGDVKDAHVQEDLESRDAMRDADALVYLIGNAVSDDDLVTLRAFRGQFADWGKSGFNSLALIGKADAVRAPGRDPFDAAAEQASDARSSLGPAVAAVLPVSPLLAESAVTGALEPADRELLGVLAAAPPPDAVLSNLTVFEQRYGAGAARLGRLLSGYGVKFAIQHTREHGSDDLGLVTALEYRSGLPAVWDLLRGHFVRHADVIKAEAALAELQSGAQAARDECPSVVDRVMLEISRTRVLPQFHRVREAALYRQVVQRSISYGATADEELEHLLALDEPRERLQLATGASDETVAHRIQAARLEWSQRRDDQRLPVPARRATLIILETLRRLRAEMNLVAEPAS